MALPLGGVDYGGVGLLLACQPKEKLMLPRRAVKTFLLAILLVVGMSASAIAHENGDDDNYRLYDEKGRYQGRVQDDKMYDARGRYEGRLKESSDGKTVRIYDNKGNYQRRVNNDKIYDSKGTYEGRVKESDKGDSYKIYDNKGSYKGRAKKY